MALSKPLKKIKFLDALDSVLSGDQSDIEDFSSDEDDEINDSDSEEEDIDGDNDDDNIAADNVQPTAPPSPSKEHIFRWRNKDIPATTGNFVMGQSDISDMKTPSEYYKFFWTDELNEVIINQTNLYRDLQSTQLKMKSSS